MSVTDETTTLAASEVPDAETPDAPTLADFVDAFWRRDGRTEGIPRVALSPLALERLERCALEFERESQKPVERRRHVGAVVTSASADEANAAGEFFVEKLNLRIVDVDARSFDGLSDADAEEALKTLADSSAHIVAIHGLDTATDARVLAAIEWADVDVLVLGYADAAAIFSTAVRRTLGHRIDLLNPTAHSGGPRFPRFF